jgi:hypothetical protein
MAFRTVALLYTYFDISDAQHDLKQRKVTLAVPTSSIPLTPIFGSGLSPQRTGFAPRSVHEGYVMDKVASGQVIVRVPRLSPVNIIPPRLSTVLEMNNRPVRYSSSKTQSHPIDMNNAQTPQQRQWFIVNSLLRTDLSTSLLINCVIGISGNVR